MSNFGRGQSRGFHTQFKGSVGQNGPYRSSGQARHPQRGISLNPLMFVMKAADMVESTYEPVNSFSDFLLNETVKRNILARGFDRPTAIQDQAIPPILSGRDLVGIANTGTGKTAAFLLPLVTKVAKDRSQYVLIVAPTRELAVQIQEEFKKFSAGTGLFSVLCIGGASPVFQARELSRGPNFVIGTPGRIKDLESQGRLTLGNCQNVVLDEVDRMLDMGFIRDIRYIISLLPAGRQSMFFSATLPEEIKQLMQGFLNDPVFVTVKTGETVKNIDQDVVRMRGRNKLDVLHDLLMQRELKKVLVFGRTKWGISKLEDNLVKRGFKVAAIHGNKSQGQRMRALEMLKSNQVQILLATDVASRGLDIEDVSHVINYDPPETYDDYVHRIGRTGRAGKKGVALTFVE